MEYIATYKINEEIHKDKLCQADFDFFFKYINKKKFTFVSLVPAEDAAEENEKYFGVVGWCSEDIENALEVRSVPVTAENVGKLLDAVNTHFFTDHMISAGWDYIYDIMDGISFEQNTED